MPMHKKKYSDKQKIAYYKKKASQASLPRPRSMAPKVRGHGNYKVSPGKGYKGHGAYLGAGLGSAVGSVVAPGIGTVLGAPIGAALGYAADKVFGWGDYKIRHNNILHPSQPPIFEGPDYVTVRHREYLGDISSTSAFTNSSYVINPGNQTTFPWLSMIADQFEQYRFNGLIFEFVSTSADALNSTNTALGNVILATDYDAEDSAYANQQQMLSAMFSNSGKPSCNIMHAIECAPDSLVTQWLYVRSSSVSNGPDARLYDLGNFQVATYGSQAAAVIGQLWVTYSITFQKPQMNNVLGLALKSEHFIMTAPSTSAYFGTGYATATPQSGSNIGCTLTANKIVFPPLISGGNYMFVYRVNGSSTLLVTPTLTCTNCSLLTNFSQDTQQSTSDGSFTATNFLYIWCIKITGQNATVQMSSGTLPASATEGDLFITQINGNMIT